MKRLKKPRFLLDFLSVYINRMGKVLGMRLLFSHYSVMASRDRTYFVRYCCLKAYCSLFEQSIVNCLSNLIKMCLIV